MAGTKLTANTISRGAKAASQTGKPVQLWDTDPKGFGVRINPDGRLSYSVRKRLGEGGRDARLVWHTFGSSDLMALSDAREAARGHLIAISQGTHLNSERRSKRSVDAFNNDKTLGGVSEEYLVRQKGNHSERYWSEVRRLFEKTIIPGLGSAARPIVEITKREITALVEAKELHSPGAARILFATLRPFFKWCVRRDLLAINPMEDLRSPPVVEARDRVLGEDEVAVLWQALSTLPYPFGPFYQLLLLTAQRRDEVSGMHWQEVNLENGEWTIPKERTKNNRAHVVHLSPQVIAILKAIPRKNSPLVFTTTGTTAISGYSKAKATLDSLTTRIVTPWRVHDLRRTAASGMAALGFQPFIIERVLNHVSGVNGGLVAVYQRHEYVKERRDALCMWADYVERLAKRVHQ